RHDLAVASAQVKSCLLLAGLYARGETVVGGPGPAREHTELEARDDGMVIDGPTQLRDLCGWSPKTWPGPGSGGLAAG
ncbi:MAG: hypothetical protein MUF54_12835, partial [Polyangiaceae bacterium]|nr:hypothetical protein [Polyangiaceae bacterium]